MLRWLVAVSLCALPGAPARAADLTVTTTADVVNGDVSSPAALVASPGPDGISLREAIMAANAAPGPHTITLSAGLAGQTIALAWWLPPHHPGRGHPVRGAWRRRPAGRDA